MDSPEKEDPCLQLFVPYKLQKAPPPQEVPPREVDGMTHQWVPASLSVARRKGMKAMHGSNSKAFPSSSLIQ